MILHLGGITLDEKYRDYISLALIFLVMLLMIMLLFLNKTAMVEKGNGSVGAVAKSLSLRTGRA